MTRIEINPNLRVKGNQTVAEFSDVYEGTPRVGARVTVFEQESGLVGDGIVTEISDDGLIYIHVDWSSLKCAGNWGNMRQRFVRPFPIAASSDLSPQGGSDG